MSFEIIFRSTIITFLQALISSSICILIGLASYKTLLKISRYKIYYLINTIIILPFFIPSLVGCLCIETAYGDSGYLNNIINIYTPLGIILAQVFFFSPIAIMGIIKTILSIPSTYYNNKQIFNISTFKYFFKIELPYLKSELLRLFFIIFTYSISCFTIFLIFGKDDYYAPLETLICKLNKLSSLNFKTSILITLIQFGLVIIPFLISILYFKNTLTRNKLVNSFKDEKINIKDNVILIVLLTFNLIPILSMFYKGLKYIDFTMFSLKYFYSIILTVSLSFISSIVSILISIISINSLTSIEEEYKISVSYIIIETMIYSSVLISLVFVGSLFNHYFRDMNIFKINSLILALIFNTFLILPYTHKIIVTYYSSIKNKYLYITSFFKISQISKFSKIEFPLLKHHLSLVFISNLIFGLGDMKSVTLYSQLDIYTLPMVVKEKIDLNKNTEALGISLFTLLLIFFILFIYKKIFDKKYDTI